MIERLGMGEKGGLCKGRWTGMVGHLRNKWDDEWGDEILMNMDGEFILEGWGREEHIGRWGL